MDHHQQELRRAAAEAFAKSLDQLSHRLAESDPTPHGKSHAAQPIKAQSSEKIEAIKFEDLAAAAADIEQFMQGGNEDSTASPDR